MEFSAELSNNIDFFKVKFNSIINSDIVIREFEITINQNKLNSAIIFIDGLIDSRIINNSVLRPLMVHHSINKSTNIQNFILKKLISQTDIKLENDYEQAILSINSGNCILLVDTINAYFNIDAKGFLQRNIDSPKNEIVIRGAQESFVENLRTNTSMLRRIINNENLIIENCRVGSITKTNIAVCYLSNIANNDLIAEVKFRINNLDVDSILSSGQLEQLIQDNGYSLFPQLLATERPDKTAAHLLEGRVAIIVNGSPYVLVAPGVLADFLSSPEDLNYKFQFANMLKLIRLIAVFFALFLPGIYLAITLYHQELLPTELLFTIEAARETVPFPIFFEILLMEGSFELIREAGLRVPSPIGPTIGIVGGIVLGEAAVSANLVSPILIIIVAITAICSFSIPDFSFNFTIRIYRFFYIILANMAGFLGIGIGIVIQVIFLCNLKSFGFPYISPYNNSKKYRSISSYFLPPIWKREYRSDTANPKKKFAQGLISLRWRQHL